MPVTHRLFAPALAATALLAACVPVDRTAETQRQQMQLAEVLAGRVAGPAEHCLPSHRTSEQINGIGPDLIVDDGRTVYVSHTAGGCEQAGHSGYVVVTRPFNSSSLCSGDLIRIVTSPGAVQAGSCSAGEFVPYRKP